LRAGRGFVVKTGPRRGGALQCVRFAEGGPRHGQNRKLGIDREGIRHDPGKSHGRESMRVLIPVAASSGSILEQIDATGLTHFPAFQPDLPHEPVLIGDVTGEFVRGFREFLFPRAFERKPKQERGADFD
jgi:hypothetical protein